MDALCKRIGAAEPAKSSMPGRLRLSKVQTKCLNYFQSGSNVDPRQALKAGFVESIPSHVVRKPKERCAIGETVDTRCGNGPCSEQGAMMVAVPR